MRNYSANMIFSSSLTLLPLMPSHSMASPSVLLLSRKDQALAQRRAHPYSSTRAASSLCRYVFVCFDSIDTYEILIGHRVLTLSLSSLCLCLSHVRLNLLDATSEKLYLPRSESGNDSDGQLRRYSQQQYCGTASHKTAGRDQRLKINTSVGRIELE
jgi:hypothetical protein